LLNVGNKIQEYRVKNGLSQEMLAENLGVSRQSVSKWELDQSLPEIDKIVAMSELFSATVDDLLSNNKNFTQKNNNKFHFGIYLIVKDFDISVDFYEKLLSMSASKMGNKFAEFSFGYNQCFSIMNELNLKDHNYKENDNNKFVLNFWIENLNEEYERIKILNIGKYTEIKKINKNYYFFNLYDLDNNIIEITGNYIK
jgi:lactoylglutathione lyase